MVSSLFMCRDSCWSWCKSMETISICGVVICGWVNGKDSSSITVVGCPMLLKLFLLFACGIAYSNFSQNHVSPHLMYVLVVRYACNSESALMSLRSQQTIMMTRARFSFNDFWCATRNSILAHNESSKFFVSTMMVRLEFSTESAICFVENNNKN